MTTNYPAALDTNIILPSAGGVGADLDDFPHSDLHGNANEAILAIETELGTAPSGSYATVKARLDELTATYTNVTKANGWANISGYDVLRYKKVGNMVHLYGAVESGTASDPTVGTLPAGFRPAAKVGQITGARVSDPETALYVDVEVESDGRIEIVGYAELETSVATYINLWFAVA